MLIGTVTRSLVATTREPHIGTSSILEVQVDDYRIAAHDRLSAHVGQEVLVLTGSAANALMSVSGKLGDAVIVAIVDKETTSDI